MRKHISGWNMLAVVLGVSAFLAAFGIALAAAVQVSREVPSTLSVVEVDVIADENLFLSHDPEGNDPVTGLEYTAFRLLPPLGPGRVIARIYIRNDSNSDLTLIEPCRQVFDGDTGSRLGEVQMRFHDFETGEGLGHTCEGTAKIEPGQTVGANVQIHDLDPDILPGDYSFTAVFGAIGPVPVEPPEGIVSWWPGDGDADDIVDDNDGALLNGATFAQGKVGEGFSFDGVDDLFEVADPARLNILGDVTLELWAKRTDSGKSQWMAGKGGGGVGGSDAPTAYMLYFHDSNEASSNFEFADGSDHVLTGPVVPGQRFHHYAYVREGDAQRLYVDGEPVSESTFEGSPGDSSGLPFTIGARRHDNVSGDFDWHLSGIIDEVTVYDRALSDEEIRAIYEAGSAGKTKP